MKKLILLLSISFFLINVLSIFTYFGYNVNLYTKYFKTSQISSSNISDTQNVYSFLQNKTPLNNNFTLLEAGHLQDVQNIFLVIHYILRIAITLFIIITSFLIYSHKGNLIFKGLFIGSIISLSLVLILLLATTLNFDSSFRLFHKILFPQGNREFAENSRLITLFPQSFFAYIAQNIFIVISAISSSIILLYFVIKKIPHH